MMIGPRRVAAAGGGGAAMQEATAAAVANAVARAGRSAALARLDNGITRSMIGRG